MYISEKTKDHILQVAEEIFARNGYKRTTNASIARLAHVSHMTVYRAFRNKENIFISLLDREFNKFYRKAMEILEDNIDSLSKLERVVSVSIGIFRNSKILQSIFIKESNHFEKRLFENAQKKSRQIYEQIVSEGIEKGEIKEVDPHLVVDLIYHLRNSILKFYKNCSPPISAETGIEIMAKILVEGIKAALRKT